MKKLILITSISFSALTILAQKGLPKIPKPEFGNEIYLFNKDSSKLVRLEKGIARMEMKAKMGGMGGMENGYELEGEKSNMRIKADKELSFIFYSGGTKSSGAGSMADSLMRSMGIDAYMMSMANPMQASQTSELTELYSMKCVKGKRKITVKSEDGDGQAANGMIQSAPNMMQAGKGGLVMGAATVGIGVGMKLLSKGKKESVKYAINIKKLREDFYEITADKNLPKGEYAFILPGAGGMDNTATLFAFSIE